MTGTLRNPIMVVFLSIITCGIYTLFWMYSFASELKLYLSDETINPGVDLLFSILCFPYFYYWVYKYSKLVESAQEKAAMTKDDNATLNIILSIFGLGLVSMAILQSSANKIWEK